MIDKNILKILKALHGRELRFIELRKEVKNPRTLANKLRKLREMELIEVRKGRYKLTQKGAKICRLLMEIEKTLGKKTKIENFERIPHQIYSPLIKKYCEILVDLLEDRLISIMLFGSIARGDWDKHSDIDILVIAEGWEEKPIWERVRELREAKEKLEQTIEFMNAIEAGYWPIIQNYPLNINEARRFNRIYLDAIIDGIILYDKDKFLEKILNSIKAKLEAMNSKRIVLPNKKYYWIIKEVKPGEVIEID